MNILFLTENEISPMMGGTEHITDTLATEFRRRGHRCYLCYANACEMPLMTAFDAKLRVVEGREEPALKAFLGEYKVDIIVSNLVVINWKRRLLPLLFRLTRGTGIRMVNCLHAMPGEELLGSNPANSLYRMFHGRGLATNLKDIALYCAPGGLVRRLFKGYLKSRYRLMYDNGDCIVMLSERFFPQVALLGGIPVDDKFEAIHSALSFSRFATIEEIAAKGREVLLISRMDEKPKRISSALRIWRRICRDSRFDDWHFTIVGGGPDLEWYRRLVRRKHIRRVSLEGRQPDIVPYYLRSAIFMMTSAYEGWGLTLTEAQQLGAVPIAFHSYASLPDIITDGENGCIVKDRDEAAFAERLMRLMSDDESRRKMSLAAVESSRRFRLEVIADQWLSLFERLLGESKD